MQTKSKHRFANVPEWITYANHKTLLTVQIARKFKLQIRRFEIRKLSRQIFSGKVSANAESTSVSGIFRLYSQ